MSEREYIWSEQGRVNAHANGVELSEVIQALYSGATTENTFDDRLVICGVTDAGRLITVLTSQWAPELIVYQILSARPAGPIEQRMWREDNQ